jgi:hypothetical protein
MEYITGELQGDLKYGMGEGSGSWRQELAKEKQ